MATTIRVTPSTPYGPLYLRRSVPASRIAPASHLCRALDRQPRNARPEHRVLLAGKSETASRISANRKDALLFNEEAPHLLQTVHGEASFFRGKDRGLEAEKRGGKEEARAFRLRPPDTRDHLAFPVFMSFAVTSIVRSLLQTSSSHASLLRPAAVRGLTALPALRAPFRVFSRLPRRSPTEAGVSRFSSSSVAASRLRSAPWW